MQRRFKSNNGSRIRLTALSSSQEMRYRSSLDAIKLIREGNAKSLTQAARESGTTVPTVLRYARSAIVRQRGRYGVRPSDRLRRELVFYTPTGRTTLVTHSSRQATEIAKYHNAVKAFVSHGDFGALQEFRNKSIVVHGKRQEFLTDTRVLNRLARAGELSVLEIYSSVGNN
jgi:hypothetical protein